MLVLALILGGCGSGDGDTEMDDDNSQMAIVVDGSSDDTSSDDTSTDDTNTDDTSTDDTNTDDTNTDSANTLTKQPERVWYRSHSGTEEESHGHFIMYTQDGGFLQIGETGYIAETGSRAKLMVIKVDSSGNQQWRRILGERGHNLGNSAIEEADSYVIVGALNRASTLIKLSKSDGSVILQKTYNLSGTNAIEHAIATDGGYALVGYTDAEDPGNTFYTEGKGLFMLVDKQGEVLQTKPGIDLNQYMSHGYRIGRSQGKLVIAGLTAGAEDYAVASFNEQTLALEWSNVYGGNQPDHLFALAVTDAGDVYVSGHTLSGTLNWDTYTIKLNSDGVKLWERKVGNPRNYDGTYIHDEVWGAAVTADGGVVIVAGTGDEYAAYSQCNDSPVDCSDEWQVYLVKFASDGVQQWQATYGSEGNGDWAGEDITITPAGEAVVAVDDGQFGFLKLASPPG